MACSFSLPEYPIFMTRFVFHATPVGVDARISPCSLQVIQRLHYTFRYPLIVLSVLSTPSVWLRS